MVCLLLCATSRPTLGQHTFYDQRPTFLSDWFWTSDSSGVESALVYDNFAVSAHAEVNTIHWRGLYTDYVNKQNNPIPPDTSSWQVSFWSDSGNRPGAQLSSSEMSLNDVQRTFVADADFLWEGTRVIAPVYDFSVTLPTSFVATPNRQYWLAVQSLSPTFNPVWSWSSGSNGDASSIQDFAGERLTRPNDRTFSLGGTPQQKVLLDWDSPVSKTFVQTLDARGDILLRPVNQPDAVATFSAPERLQIEQSVRQILMDSGLGSLQLVNSPGPDVLNVRFSPGLLDAGRRTLGYAFDVRPSTTTVGADRGNQRLDGEVAVFMHPAFGDSPERIAETVVHEIGHALGAEHVDAGFLTPEIMDSNNFSPELERFTNGPYPLLHSKTPGADHNPKYHLLRYTMGLTNQELAVAGIEPGTWDQLTAPLTSRRIDSFDVDTPLYDVILQGLSADGPEPDWLPIAVYDSLMPGTLYDFSSLIPSDVTVRIVAASTPNGPVDLFLGSGDTLDPMLQLDTEHPVLDGLVFRFDPVSSQYSLAGRFQADVVVVPEPPSILLAMIAITFLLGTALRRISRRTG